jgi:hypothetical protein
MNSATTDRFRRAYADLPQSIQRKARKAYRLWQRDCAHPSLHFKKTGKVWSARVDDNYRVLGDLRGATVYWLWIGAHDGYLRLISER